MKPPRGKRVGPLTAIAGGLSPLLPPHQVVADVVPGVSGEGGACVCVVVGGFGLGRAALG